MARKPGARDKKKRNRRRNMIIGGVVGGAGLIGLGAGGAMYAHQYTHPKKTKRANPTSVKEAKQNIREIYEDATIDRKVGRIAGAVDFEIKRGYVEGFLGRAVQSAKEEFPHVVQIPIQMGRESRRKTDRFLEERIIKGTEMRKQISERLAKRAAKDRIARKQVIRDIGILGRRIVKGTRL